MTPPSVLSTRSEQADTRPKLRALFLLTLAVMVPSGGVSLGALLGTPIEGLGGLML
jgi:hypothetical protein